MEQIIVLKELLRRVVRFHALGTDEALKHKSPPLESVCEKKKLYKSLKINQDTSDVWSWFSSALGGSDSAFWEPPFPGVLEQKSKGDSSLKHQGDSVLDWIKDSLINVMLKKTTFMDKKYVDQK